MENFRFKLASKSEPSSSLGSDLLSFGQKKLTERLEITKQQISKPIEKYTSSLGVMSDSLELGNAIMLDNLEQNVKSNNLLKEILNKNIQDNDKTLIDLPNLPKKLKDKISRVPNKFKIGFIGAAIALGALGLYSVLDTEDDEQQEIDQPEEIENIPNDIQTPPTNPEESEDIGQPNDIQTPPINPEESEDVGQPQRSQTRRQSQTGNVSRVSYQSNNPQAFSGTQIDKSSDSSDATNKNIVVKAKSVAFLSDNFILKKGSQQNATGITKASFSSDTNFSAPPGAQFAVSSTSGATPMQGEQFSGGDLLPPVQGPVSSGFGQRARGNHEGLDFAVPVGTSVIASTGGTVIFAGERGNYGNLVTIQSPDGIETRYAHLSSIGVAKGDAVTAGQEIAKSGNTGLSTGPHLHFEVRRGGTPIDPKTVLGSAAQAPSKENEMPGEPTPAGQATAVSTENQSGVSMMQASSSVGSSLNEMSTQSTIAESAPPQVSVSIESDTDTPSIDMSIGRVQTPIDPNEPGPVGISEELVREFFGEIMS